MKSFLSLLLLGGLALSLIRPASGGQEVFAPLAEVVRQADVIWIFEIEETKEVPVTAGSAEIVVQVSTARCVEAIKGPPAPSPFVLVSSSQPNSSAVWRRLPKGTYLGFLSAEQAHFRFPYNLCVRPIDAQGNLEWIEQDEKGVYVNRTLPLTELIARIRRELPPPTR